MFYAASTAAYTIFLVRQKKQYYRGGVMLLAVGFTIHLIMIVIGTIQAGHLPVNTLRDTLSFGALAVAGVFLLFQYRYRLKVLGVFTAPLAAVIMIIVALMPVTVMPAQPVLKSMWLVSHVALIFIGEASLALGATRSETLWRVVLPMASPGMMTGVILAVARAAGEVAPLMLVGVVKLAPSLPLDGDYPFLHPERKFMHLGFHIYDVGFQSPNVEAARPLVYATALLLVLVILLLNMVAIHVRNGLREKYRGLET